MATPADFVLQLLQNAPHSAALSLAGQRLDDVTLQRGVLPTLQRFHSLTELDLAHNSLSSVDSLRTLSKLQRLVRAHTT